MVRDGHEGAGRIAADDGVEAEELVAAGFEFVLRHVGRIEVRPGRFGADAVDERLVAVEPVPRAVVDLGIPSDGRVERGEEGVAVAVGFEPEHLVHRLGRVDQQRKHAALVLGQFDVGREPDGGVLVEALLHRHRHRGGRVSGSGLHRGVGAAGVFELAAAESDGEQGEAQEKAHGHRGG